MSNWARIGLNTRLRHDFSSFPPSDHWAQVDMQLTSQMGAPGGSPGTGNTPYFIWLANFLGLGAFSNCTPTPCWRWSTGSAFAATGPSPNTPFTVGYHVHGGGFDTYVNGVLVTSQALTGSGSFNYMFLNYSAAFSCCQVVYYTNVKVGTSQGAGDIFSDDFSAGLNNWYIEAITTGYPLVASVVSAPADDACPVLTASPVRAGPGEDFTLNGSGFDPGSPITVYFTGGGTNSTPVESPVVVADGIGNIHEAMTVPRGVGNGSNGNFPILSDIVAVDTLGRVGCAPFYVCGSKPSDGIQANWDNPIDQEPTNTPNPIVAAGGNPGTGSNQATFILDYIWHDDAHWVLWRDPSVIDNAGVFNPIPANHSLNATRISADGSSVVDYPIDTGYAWEFGEGGGGDPGLGDSWPPCGAASPVWDRTSYFSGWVKPIYDARFASDGTNLWVGVVTAESVPYPWIDNKDAHGLNPGGAAQATPLSVLTSGFTSFATSTSGGYHRYYTNPTGPIDIFKDTAFPLTDAGILGMGVWNPPVVVIFAWGGGGFTRIGEIDAKYCPSVVQQTDGYGNVGGSLIGGIGGILHAPRGTLWGRVAMAASPNEPGVCHVVWSEGGDWGRVSDGTPCVTGPFGGSRLTWDAGPANRSYRVNYTTWSPSAKLTDQELWESHIDRTNWYVDGVNWDGDFERSGYTWPAQADFGALLCYDLRNDNADGNILLFCGITQSINGPDATINIGYPTPAYDYGLIFCDTLHVYEIGGGTPILLQIITPDLLPNQAEGFASWPLSSGSNVPDATPVPTASDCMYAGPYPYNTDSFIYNTSAFGPQAKGFGISDIYEDPLLGGAPVYLVHVPWARRNPDRLTFGYGNWHMRGLYRVPADMSGPFEFLDGDRQLQFSVLGGVMGELGSDSAAAFDSGDFFSDPHNIWIPAPNGGGIVNFGTQGYWFDRICGNKWQILVRAETPSDFSIPGYLIGEAACPGFHYDPGSDSLAYVCPVDSPVAATRAFAVQRFFFCRGCRSCPCGVGVHIAHRF